MSTQPQRRRTRRPQRPMIADLTGYHTAAAVETAQTLLDQADIYPGPVDAATQALARIDDWARHHNADQISDLTGEHAERLLLDLTDAGSLHPTDPVAAESLHLHRNTLNLLRLTVLLARPSVVTRRSDRPGRDTVAAGLPKITPRTGYRVRGLRDDEIALARMLSALDLQEQAPLLPVHNYLLSDAGLAPMEITDAAVAKLTHEDGIPTGITARGLHNRGPRQVHFDAWQQHTLASTLPEHLRSGRPYLAYSGTRPGTKEACASTGPVLTRFLRRAGITGRDVNAGSVALWRSDHVLQQHRDLAAASNIAGTKASLLLENLHYTVDEINVHRGIATLVALDTRPDVQVPAGQVRGLGSWTENADKPGTLIPAA